MEAVKCPNCGSEKVQELTEEKYVCLACDNVFLVHNLSKEFRMTDEHIADVHADLKDAINNISIIAGSQNSEVDVAFENAFHLIKIEKYELALEKFEVLCNEQSMTYRSWWGRILSITRNLKLKDENVICSNDMMEYIGNMRKCSDYSDEIEDKFCQYLSNVFEENYKMLLLKLKNVENDIENMDKEIKNIENTIKNLEGERGNIEEQEEKRKSKRGAMTVGQVIGTIVAILLAEIKVVEKLFIGWVGESIAIVNAPLPEASDPGAWGALGSAAGNFILIPIKIIISVVVAGIVAYVVYIIVGGVLEALKPDVKENVVQFYKESEASEEALKALKSNLDLMNKKHQNLKRCLGLYEKMDIKDLTTVKAYVLSKNRISG